MQSIKFAERSKNKDLNNAVNTLDFITMYYSFSPQSRKCTFFFLHQAVNYKSLVYTQLQCPRPARSTPLCMFISPVRLCEVDLYGQGLPVLQLLDGSAHRKTQYRKSKGRKREWGQGLFPTSWLAAPVTQLLCLLTEFSTSGALQPALLFSLEDYRCCHLFLQ